MEQVIKEQVKKECDKLCICIYEETEGSIRVFPYCQIVSSRLIKAIDMIKEEYAEMVDYHIGYDGLSREIFVFVEIHFNPNILDVASTQLGFLPYYDLVGRK